MWIKRRKYGCQTVCGWLPWWMRRVTPPAVLLCSDWVVTDSECRPPSLPETRTFRARQQQLPGWMRQIEVLSALHIVVDLLRRTNVSLFIYIMGQKLWGCENKKAAFFFFLIMFNTLRKTQKKQPRAEKMKWFLPHNIHFTWCIFLYLCITFNSGVIANSSCASAIIGSNFLLTEQRSRCEKKELNREKCHWGSGGGERLTQKWSAEMNFVRKNDKMSEKKVVCESESWDVIVEL